MGHRPFLLVSGTIFFVVGLLHAVRLILRWPVTLGARSFPEWASALAAAAAWGMTLWALRLLRRTT